MEKKMCIKPWKLEGLGQIVIRIFLFQVTTVFLHLLRDASSVLGL